MECISCHSTLIDDAAYCPQCGARQPDVPECDTMDYAAFISYRHRSPDTEVAVKLHRAIEAYRLPASVAEKYGAPQLGRMFRDQDELPATGSLPTAIRNALRHSRTLVVICSPTTPESRWVAQEIELFASFHGRDRVFAVLAEGASAESMPAALRSCIRVNPDGTTRTAPTEPLAADMRPAAASRFNDEKLRIIAAIAGCGYDELRQRERTRKRKFSLGLAAAAIALVAVIGGFAWQAGEQRTSALIEESQRLAAESQQLLSQGDRYGAIETALSALPSSSGDSSRPLVPEAQEALEQALQIHASPTSPWLSSYALQLKHSLDYIEDISMINVPDADPQGAGKIAVSRDGGFFAVSDNTGTVCTYDLLTGKHLATCKLPDPLDPSPESINTRKLVATADRLVVSEPASSIIACFDPFSGESIWSYDQVSVATMEITPNGQHLDIASFTADNSFYAAEVDLETSNMAESVAFGGAEFPELGHGVYSAVGETPTEYYVAVGPALARVDLKEETMAVAPLAYTELSGLAHIDGTTIACTVETYDGQELELHYAVEAFDSELKPLWEHRGTLASEMMTNDDYTTLVLGWPTVWGTTRSGDIDCAVVNAGRNVYALDLKTGEAAYEHGFAGTVLTVYPREYDGKHRLLIACADGSIVVENPESPTRNYDGDQFRLQLGKPIRWSGIALHDGWYTWLSATTDAPDRLVAYRTTFSTDEELAREYTLDELIEQGHTILDERS